MSNAADIGSGDRLSFTIFLAIAVHAIIIFGVTFTVDSGKKVAPNLNITLATHDSKKPPEKADFLAQHNQQASGTLDEVKELTVTDIAEIQDTQIRDVSPVRKVNASGKQDIETRIITTTSKSTHQVDLKKAKDLNNEITEERDGQNENILLEQEYASLKAKHDRQKQAYANRPRIRVLNSVSTKENRDAKYLNDWAQKIEQVGNNNFPEAALQKEIFGSLRLLVIILPNGAVENIEILQSSGHGVLDEAALHIVKLASPFKPFPKEIRVDTDKLEIIRTWNFQITGLKTSR